MKHAAGVFRLIERRGPGSFSNDWDKSMLLAFRPIIVNCYLAHNRRQPVMRHDEPGQAGTSENVAFKNEGLRTRYARFSSAASHCIRALREGNVLRKGGGCMGYWASTIVVDVCPGERFYREYFSEADALFASNIFRSIESLNEGAMGPLRCAYPVRVAFEIADGNIRDYVRRWTGILGQRYGAMAIYDELPLDDFESRMKDLRI